MTGFNRWKACRYGILVYNANDLYVGRSLDLYGEFSHGEVELFRQLVRPGDAVVEVGANIGAHTLSLARMAGPDGVVLAFEPQRLPFQALCANMALNSIPNAYCHQVAIGREAGMLLVPELDAGQGLNFGGLALGDHRQGEPVRKLPLDAFPLERCRLIKVDVEGMEREVLEGGEATIRRHRPFLYVENDRPDKSDALVRHIDGLGYRMYWHRPPLYNPDNYLKNAENVFGGIVSINMLCVPREQRVEIVGFRPVEVARRPDGQKLT